MGALTFYADHNDYKEAFEDGAWVVSNPGEYPAARHMTITHGDVLLRFTYYFNSGWNLLERTVRGKHVAARTGLCQTDDQELLTHLSAEAPIYREN